MDLSKKYQKKTDKEHILSNPDTYIGSVELIENQEFIFDDVVKKIKSANIEYIPGLFKLFDEGLVNSRDHVIRMLTSTDEDKCMVTKIDISVTDDGVITIMNDGNGIDIQKHPEYDIWIPEMIFAHLRTGTNYDKEEKKIVGGKNGFGVKLIYIWSTFGELETVDHKQNLKYHQQFTNNLDTIHPPTIEKLKKKTKPYTKITFKPDYERLGIQCISPNIIALFKKRVYDIAAVTDKSVKVSWNGESIPVKDFPQYVDTYIGAKSDTQRIHEAPNERWEYVVALSNTDEFHQISFVNGIATTKGGKHVEYILNQIVKKVIVVILKKKKMEVKPAAIKDQLILFLRCDIENPAFDSQTKDYMNTPVNKFGSTCVVGDKFIDKIIKLGVMDNACAVTTIKENKTAKKSDGNKSKNVRGIPKLVDANFAGTSKSHLCTIIFCEGDSAKAGIISGLSKDDRNVIGVYPMKGKIFNVRGETLKKISENKEIIEIKQILGLETGVEYQSLEEVQTKLRYGQILFMTDQDLDGSHIKGLCVNLFEAQWHSLINFSIIGFMNTPILKARKGTQELVFYNENDYLTWKEHDMVGNWNIKYYKGLGTSTSKEFKEYFQHKKIINFTHSPSCDNCIDLVFNKKRADDRKQWLSTYDRTDTLNTNNNTVSFTDFIHKEMKHFSKYDCDRSIPNLIDGLKISQRKILYSAFKKRLTNEIKVAQFSGYVSEHSCYHHGEASLNGAIVGLAQDYVGSNNINLFQPNGQFGTRLNGGKDSASERYIYTLLNPMTRYIFREEDDVILQYLDDDGTPVEPIYYIPIIPMLLVNGSKGIGTGFSTDIPCYNPSTIIDYLTDYLYGKSVETYEFKPFYKGFAGNISDNESMPSKYIVCGSYEIMNDTHIRITELPVGTWTDDYKKFLEDLVDQSKSHVRDFNDMSTDVCVDIVVKLTSGSISSIKGSITETNYDGIHKYFKLVSSISTTNMNAFDHAEHLQHYTSPNEILNQFISIRQKCYEIRKQYIIKQINADTILLQNKSNYISAILNDKIDLRKKSKTMINQLFVDYGFAVIDGDTEFKYLTKMPMDSVSEENYNELNSRLAEKKKNLHIIENTTIKQLWLKELEELKNFMITTNKKNLKSTTPKKSK
jgi:DNA topoisomerase-2